MIVDLRHDPATGTMVEVPRLRWVRLAQYCKATGDSPDAVHARRRKRQWIDGRQCKVDPSGNVWVSAEELNRRLADAATEPGSVGPDAGVPAACG